MLYLLEMALSNLVVALALAAVAAVVSLCCRRPALVHFLWALVLLKLVTPPLVRVPLPWPAQAQSASAPGPQVEAPAEEAPARAPEEVEWELVDPGEVAPGAAEVAIPLTAPPDEKAPEPEEPAPAPEAPWWPGVVAGVWLAGAMGWYGLAWWRAREFSRLLRLARPAPERLAGRVARLAALAGVKAPRVVLVPGRLPPLVWGAVWPTLVLPQGVEALVGEQGLDALLLHELAHVRRGDPWLRWLESAALGLWWWCPLAWYASREMREAEEQCCDAWVVRWLPGQEKAYATALVDVLDFLAEATDPPLMASGLGRVADLKRRLTMILSGMAPALMGRTAWLAVALAVLALPLVPSFSEAQAPLAPAEKKDVLFLKAGEGQGFLALKFVEAGDVKALEEELARKKAEVEVLAKKLADAKKAKPKVEKLPPLKAARLHAGSGMSIVIHLSGAEDHKQIEAILKKLKAALGEAKGGKVEVEIGVARVAPADKLFLYGVPGKDAAPLPPRAKKEGHYFTIPLEGGKEGGFRLVVPAEPKFVPRPPVIVKPPAGAVPQPVPTPGRAREERMERLERALKSLMREMEQMRKEMKERR